MPGTHRVPVLPHGVTAQDPFPPSGALGDTRTFVSLACGGTLQLLVTAPVLACPCPGHSSGVSPGPPCLSFPPAPGGAPGASPLPAPGAPGPLSLKRQPGVREPLPGLCQRRGAGGGPGLGLSTHRVPRGLRARPPAPKPGSEFGTSLPLSAGSGFGARGERKPQNWGRLWRERRGERQRRSGGAGRSRGRSAPAAGCPRGRAPKPPVPPGRAFPGAAAAFPSPPLTGTRVSLLDGSGASKERAPSGAAASRASLPYILLQ